MRGYENLADSNTAAHELKALAADASPLRPCFRSRASDKDRLSHSVRVPGLALSVGGTRGDRARTCTCIRQHLHVCDFQDSAFAVPWWSVHGKDLSLRTHEFAGSVDGKLPFANTSEPGHVGMTCFCYDLSSHMLHQSAMPCCTDCLRTKTIKCVLTDLLFHRKCTLALRHMRLLCGSMHSASRSEDRCWPLQGRV
jgi:hypothetical protein